MRFVHDLATDPAFNLAAEEYLLLETTDPVFRIWRNEPCVVIGKHQNAYEEIDIACLNEAQLPVFRRMSGGGTVYHDLGNINFTFITAREDSRQIDFCRALEPMIGMLRSLGLQAEMTGKSDLSISGRKFSGNAIYAAKHRSLHHGTLLFDADLEMLDKVLTTGIRGYRSRAIRSVRSKVTNLREHLADAVDTPAFIEMLKVAAPAHFGQGEWRGFDESERRRIEEVAACRYTHWEWNFGRAPAYQLECDLDGTKVSIEVKEGRIVGTQTADAQLAGLLQLLHGELHVRQNIEQVLKRNKEVVATRQLSLAKVLDALF